MALDQKKAKRFVNVLWMKQVAILALLWSVVLITSFHIAGAFFSAFMFLGSGVVSLLACFYWETNGSLREYGLRDPLDQEYTVLRTFFERTHFPEPQLFTACSPHGINGYAFYLNGEKSLAISVDAYRDLDFGEIRALVAHEMAHVRCHDLAFTVFLKIGFFLSCIFLAILGLKFLVDLESAKAVLALLAFFLFPYIWDDIWIKTNEIQELRADALGVLYLGDVSPLLSIIKKMIKFYGPCREAKEKIDSLTALQ